MLIPEQLLEKVGTKLIDRTRESQKRRGMVASGKTSQSLRAIVKRVGSIVSLAVHGSHAFRYQVKGRRPGTGKKVPGALYRAIKEWIEIRGFNMNPWAVARSIHVKGIKVPNKHNDGKVLEPLAPTTIKSLLKADLRPSLIQSVRSQLFS